MHARLVFVALAFAAPLQAQDIDLDAAREYFRDAHSAARTSHVWGVDLYGPILFVNARTRQLVANQPDAAGTLIRAGDVWTGRYPDTLAVYNGATEWHGTRWTLLSWPLPAGRHERLRLMTHELFHRIQPELGHPALNPGNAHLDTEAARVLLRLEWRALQRAIASQGRERVNAIADALAYRLRRHAQFPEGAVDERALELNEGLAEYTGVRAAIPEMAVSGWVFRQIDNADGRARGESVIRNFAYTSGPAYGVLLDAAQPRWHRDVSDSTDLGTMLSRAIDVRASAAPRDSLYAASGVRREEAARELERQEQEAAFRRRFVEQPTITLPALEKFNFAFNPNGVAPFGEQGTVYLTATVRDEWGTLSVTAGGVLFVREAGRVVRIIVPASKDGYELELLPGWTIANGTVVRR